ncbi:aldehyde oxidase [Cystobacter fuscus]|uniref:Aldehyde oxidase n=1 Tax=Cystobacter fuscus TaxID=43 RepID=A0A250J533_9BACT|nr:hypothetical protein [Cystobacter fuscus]ATB38276.1 aldehyde oxidase [Cystobacter fuscus]
MTYGTGEHFTPENLATNMPFLALVRDRARRENATPGQIALAWAMAQRPRRNPCPT